MRLPISETSEQSGLSPQTRQRRPWQKPQLRETALPDLTRANFGGFIPDDPFDGSSS